MEISTEIFEAMSGAVAGGMAASIIIVSAMSVVVSGLKALLRMIGR